MTPRDIPEFTRLMKRLGVTFSREVNQELVDVYYEALKHIDPYSLDRAVKRATSEMEWFPKPKDLAGLSTGRDEGPKYIAGERVYRCLECKDMGLRIRQTPHGSFVSPCICPGGEAERNRWRKVGAEGSSIERTARDNSRRLAEAEAKAEDRGITPSPGDNGLAGGGGNGLDVAERGPEPAPDTLGAP